MIITPLVQHKIHVTLPSYKNIMEPTNIKRTAMQEADTKEELLSGSSWIGLGHLDSAGGSNLVMFGIGSDWGN